MEKIVELEKKVRKDCVSESQLMQELFEIYFDSLTTSKHISKLESIISDLEKKYGRVSLQDGFDNYLLSFIKTSKKDRSLQTLSQLLDFTTFGKFCMERHISLVFDVVLTVMDSWLQHPNSSTQFQLQLSIRTILQLCQHFYMNKDDYLRNSNNFSKLKVIHEHICQSLEKVIINKYVPVECAMLAGTCLARLLNLILKPQEGAHFFLKLLKRKGINSVEEEDIFKTNSNACFSDDDFICGHFISEAQNSDPDFVSLVLVNGLLNCSSNDLLLCRIDDFPLLLHILPVLCKLCQILLPNQFHTFQVLLTWLRVTQKCLPQIYQCLHKSDHTSCSALEDFSKNFSSSSTNILDARSEQSLLKQNNQNASKKIENVSSFTDKQTNFSIPLFILSSDVFKLLFNVISCNWDSPVQGVMELVSLCFKQLLINHIDELHLLHFNCDLISQMVHYHAEMPWILKGKYPPISALIPHYGVHKFLKDYLTFPVGLTESLSSNPLASAGADVYRTVLLTLRNEADNLNEEFLASQWAQYWLKPIILCLESSNSLVHQNLLRHWIPNTLKQFPGTYNLLVNELRQRQSTTHRTALITIMKIARSTGIVLLESMNIEDIRECLFHLDEDVRIQGFALVCICHKKAEPLSEVEIKLTQEFLPYNLNIDNAPFRQQLSNHVKTLLIRLRDSCICFISSYVKNKNTEQSEKLQESLEFVEWLYDLSVNNLFPGGSYQRRQTCLDLITTVLDIFASKPDPNKRKGAVPEKTPVLVSFASKKGLWNFFSDKVFQALLCCVQDFMNEIKTLVVNILKRYFYQENIDNRMPHILKQGLKYLESPKFPVCESGALLITLVFVRYLKRNEASDAVAVLKLLVNKLKQQFAVAKQDILKASQEAPMHGLMLALRMCLTEAECIEKIKDLEISYIIDETWILAESIIEYVLQVLSSKSNFSPENAAPSFAEMGEAIDDILEAAGIAPDSHDSALPLEHQLVLACCWLNLKECSWLIGDLVSNLKVISSETSTGLLSVNQVERGGQLLLTVLTRCRHRGAIEACSLSLGCFCKKLLCSSEDVLRDIPSKLLDSVLESIESPSAASSITRRSAGFPLLIQAIVTNEPRLRKRTLLEKTINKLIRIASEPLPTFLQETVDLPQAHTLHILRTLVHDASVSQDMIVHVTPIIQLCIQNFSSQSWAVRNAALQLYGSLIPRLLGQKKVRDEASQHNSLTADALFNRHPDLQTYLLSVLNETMSKGQEAHPTLVPVLSLLAKLTPASGDFTSFRISETFTKCLLNLLESPIFLVRELAAQALLAMLKPDERMNTLRTLLEYLQANEEKLFYNKVHGYLLAIHKLLSNISHPSEKDVNYLNKCFNDCQWLMYDDRTPFLVKSLFLKILSESPVWLDVAQLIETTVKNIILQYKKSLSINWEPGFNLWISQLTEIDLNINKKADLLSCFSSDSCQDVLIAVFTFCKDNINYFAEEDMLEEVEITAKKLICDHFHPSVIQLGLEVVIASRQQKHTGFSKDMWEPSVIVFLQKTSEGQYGTTASALATIVLSYLIQELILSQTWSSSSQEIDLLSCWVKQIWKSSQPLQAEDLRIKAAEALQIAGVQILSVAKSADDKYLHEAALQLFDATLLLLTDEFIEVRQQAAIFVGRIPRLTTLIQYQSIHSNFALQVLCSYMTHEFEFSKSFLHTMWKKLCSDKTSTTAILQSCCNERNFVLFEQEDVNIFAERPILIQSYAYYLKLSLKQIQSSGNKQIDLWCEELATATLLDTKTTVAFLKEILSDTSDATEAFSVTTQTRGYLAIWRLQCQLDVLLSYFPVENVLGTELNIWLDELQRLSFGYCVPLLLPQIHCS